MNKKTLKDIQVFYIDYNKLQYLIIKKSALVNIETN